MTMLGRFPCFLLAATFAALILGGLVVTGGTAEAADVAQTPEPRVAAQQTSDEFHVSDETLATSIFIPTVFIVATIAVFVWAVGARARRSDAEKPMPWWRTSDWYSRNPDEQ